MTLVATAFTVTIIKDDDGRIACDHHACMSMNLTGDGTKPISFTSTGRMRRCSEHNEANELHFNGQDETMFEHIGYRTRKETLLQNTSYTM